MQSRYPLLKKWTAEEHERLKALAEAGWRPDAIAGELGRSEAAVGAPGSTASRCGSSRRSADPENGPPLSSNGD
ncbi:hypothetical protein [Bradyrhizobium sp. USDA 3650]